MTKASSEAYRRMFCGVGVSGGGGQKRAKKSFSFQRSLMCELDETPTEKERETAGTYGTLPSSS